MDAVAGATDIETSVPVGAGVTVRLELPEMEPREALIVLVPGATAVATPELLTVATAVELELQLAWLVTSCVVPSLNVPVAV